MNRTSHYVFPTISLCEASHVSAHATMLDIVRAFFRDHNSKSHRNLIKGEQNTGRTGRGIIQISTTLVVAVTHVPPPPTTRPVTSLTVKSTQDSFTNSPPPTGERSTSSPYKRVRPYHAPAIAVAL